jgi:tetratricopeptide (TPR) repeat protein
MSVTSLNLVNPYIVGRPIYEPELFFGRRKLFRFIEDNLRQGVQVILLHGQRRIGKSSVLMQIPNFVGKDNFIFIYFDLHDKSNLPLSSILQNLAIAINQKLDQLGLSSFADEPFSVTSLEASLYESNYPKLFLNEFLPKVIDILDKSNQKIVLLLDEFDVLNNQSSGSLTEQFFVYLQSLISQYSELFLIPVVGRRIEDLDNLKSLFKQAPNHEIGLLDTKEAKDLILKPVGNSLKYVDDAVTAILELTSGHAYLTQAVCYSLFLQAEEEEKSVITAADVNAIVDDAIELAQGGLAWFRDGLPISERVVFSAVAQAEKVADKDLDKAIEEPLKLLREYGVITTTALSKAPENLVQWNFLERVEDSEFRYRIKVKLVRYWLTRSYPLRQAIWELQDADLEAQELFEWATEVSEQRDLPLSNLYETILELNPNHFPALFKVSEVYLDVKDFEKSREHYKRAYEVDPTRADEGYKLAKKGFYLITIIGSRENHIIFKLAPIVVGILSIVIAFSSLWQAQKVLNWFKEEDCSMYKPSIIDKQNNQTNAIIIGSQSPKNVRSGFGTVCPVIETINTGTRIQVIAFAIDNDGYKWYSIYNPKTHIAGWIAGQLIEIDKSITPVPLSSPQPTTKPSPSK